jgi:hypothetical protein
VTNAEKKTSLKQGILKMLEDRHDPIDCWDILLHFSRYAIGRESLVEEKEKHTDEWPKLKVSYDPTDVSLVLEVIKELSAEGKCNLALKELLRVGDFAGGTLTSTYQFAIVHS